MSASAPLLALKVDVDTLRGTREGATALARLFARYRAHATFLFSVGPDHTGRALRRLLRPGFVRKVARTSVLSHYGVRTLLHGTLLPGPHIGRRCAGEMRAIHSAGFEVGLHSYDHVRWQDYVGVRDGDWTEQEMWRGLSAFRDVFGVLPQVHGAAGWQMNDAAFRTELKFGIRYASDTRGSHPFRPVLNDAQPMCPQLPTTLPTLDELIGVGGCRPDDAAAHLLALTRTPRMHVFTLHAELEGMRLQPVLETLLQGWRAQGYALVALADVFGRLDAAELPWHRVAWRPIAGRSGNLMTQGAAYASPAEAPA